MLAGIDIGGTFTDAAFVGEKGLEILKVPSTPRAPEQAVNAAFARFALEPRAAERFVHGTTIITNLLIERNGGSVAFVTTQGFEDILEMQTGDKPNTYDISWVKPDPFVRRPLCLGVAERIDWRGRVETPLAPEEIERVVAALRELRCDAVAVCLLNAHANPVHERALRQAIEQALPSVFCCASSDVDPAVREYERASTTVLNAYAMPAVSAYVSGRRSEWGAVQYMSSRGGAVVADVASRLPISLAFSGPAGGVVGAASLARAAGYGDVITFDMGGTSTDVAIVRGGKAELRRLTDIEWGIPYRFPSLDIKSVGAGGGSILWSDAGGALRVGPRSAGVEPGPASYGRGGTVPTVTDVNLLLGLLPGDSLGYGSIRLDRTAASEAVGVLARLLERTVDDLAFGAWRIVNASMAQAIREITVHKGIDPRDFSLFCFGSAAGQHAVDVARAMRLGRVIVPASASVFSAVGMLSARLELYGSRAVDAPLASFFDDRSHQAAVASLENELRTAHAADSAIGQVIWTLECRHIGQTHTLDVAYAPGSDTEASVRERFLSEHDRLYGVRGDTDVEVVNAKVALTSPDPDFDAWRPQADDGDVAVGGAGHVPIEGGDVPVVPRSGLRAGEAHAGPLLVADRSSTIYVPSGASCEVDAFGSLLVETGV